MTPTQHEKNEWFRLATAAFAAGRNSMGCRFSGAACGPDGTRMATATYDSLQADYRAWLIGGFGS